MAAVSCHGLFAAKEVISAKAGIDADELLEDEPTPEITKTMSPSRVCDKQVFCVTWAGPPSLTCVKHRTP